MSVIEPKKGPVFWRCPTCKQNFGPFLTASQADAFAVSHAASHFNPNPAAQDGDFKKFRKRFG